jgi:Glycosyl transferase family 2
MRARALAEPVDPVDAQGEDGRRRGAAASGSLISAVVPMFQDRDDVAEVYRAYQAAIAGIGRPYELVYVVDREHRRALAALRRLEASGEAGLVVETGQQLDEAKALMSGFAKARGDVLLTLPPDLQVDPADIPKVVGALDSWEVAVGRRPPVGSKRESLQARAFHGLLNWLFGHSFTDLVCRVRAWRRPVIEEVVMHGVQPHFLPLLAGERGFRITQVDVRPGPTGLHGVKLGLLDRLRVGLDILALYLVLKFTKKPLRFFGMLGLPLLALGLLGCVALTVAKLFYGVPLADRPALVLAVLMVVLGIQVIALGLIGELVIFASGRRIKEQVIERIVGGQEPERRR